MQNHSSYMGRLTGWVLALVATPTLYLLSEPPIWYLTASDIAPRPRWSIEYAGPFIWARDETILEKPLNHYEDWWGDIILK
jgi:hypothetical protein